MKLTIHTQPDDETCGPTSLHAVYQYYNDSIALTDVLDEVERVATGGTLAAFLGQHALKRGYNVELYVYNVTLFDPTWFVPQPLSMESISDKLRAQLEFKKDRRFLDASNAYLEFLKLGGTLRFSDLTNTLLASYFDQNLPIITGLSSTYLYQVSREFESDSCIVYDDLRGEPSGHFVVLCGQDLDAKTVTVADPHIENTLSHDNYYVVDSMRLINAIMLGVLTYDANLLIIKPKGYI